jgi:hypothetical protein
VLIEFIILRFRPFICSVLHVLVAYTTGNALTGIMAGKICVMWFSILTIMNYEVMKRKNYFFKSHYKNEVINTRYYFVFLMKSPSLEKLGSQIRYQYKYLFHK